MNTITAGYTKIRTVPDAQPPHVSTVEITSTAPQLNNTYYKLGDIITVEVTFESPRVQ